MNFSTGLSWTKIRIVPPRPQYSPRGPWGHFEDLGWVRRLVERKANRELSLDQEKMGSIGI